MSPTRLKCLSVIKIHLPLPHLNLKQGKVFSNQLSVISYHLVLSQEIPFFQKRLFLNGRWLPYMVANSVYCRTSGGRKPKTIFSLKTPAPTNSVAIPSSVLSQ